LLKAFSLLTKDEDEIKNGHRTTSRLIDDEMKSLKIISQTFPFKSINKKCYFVFTEIKNSYIYMCGNPISTG